jgi:uncharacterized lipoprotein NlpE involved in copper resistance
VKKYVFIVLAILVVGYLVGCGKKQEALEEMQEPMPIEQAGQFGVETKAMPESTTLAEQGATAAGVKLEPLPPSGPYTPSAKEIQLALKNAGLYGGLIDGKIGPMTKKAIEEFQKANNLKVDGKVGLKTWVVLSSYLSPQPAETTAAKKSKRR